MTATSLNPFPDYAVTRLAAGQDVGPVTIVTPAIEAGRQLVQRYVAGVGTPLKPGQTNAALCAIRGDYGTGKTHLLNDVATQLEAACTSDPPPSIVRITCIQATPLSWYLSKIGTQLDTLPLYDIALEIYAGAGKTVAGATALTESAVAMLEQDPKRILDLVRSNHLSIDAVRREYEKQIGIICKDYNVAIKKVLARLVLTDDLARKWIRGEKLNARETELLGVPESIDSDEQASAVIGAIALMHKAVRRPFMVQIDELEHFARFDAVTEGSSRNMTWLKRLLEQLADAGALALVAGHWDAWNTTKDYLDRFPQYAPIDLVKLEATEVLSIIELFLGTLPAGFGLAQAAVIAKVTNGNMRRLMSLCNLLFRETDGFVKKVAETNIHEVWTSVAQRISKERALEKVVELLETRGYSVAAEETFHSIPFDLVAERSDGRVILVQSKHANDRTAHRDAAHDFIDKLKSIAASAPRAVGMFLANGSIDDEMLQILRNSKIENLRWFDLTSREALDDIEKAIKRIDGPLPAAASSAMQNAQHAPAPAAPAMNKAGLEEIEAQAEKLRKMNRELEAKLEELNKRRDRENEELARRLELLTKEGDSRLDAVRQEATQKFDRARASYEAMIEHPSVNKKLGYMRPALLFGGTYIAFGIVLVLSADIYRSFVGPESYQPVMPPMFVATGILTALAGLWVIWQRFSQVAAYFEFSRQVISDLYLREVPINTLTTVNMTLRKAIRRHGPRRAHDAAVRELRDIEALPKQAQSYLKDLELELD